MRSRVVSMAGVLIAVVLALGSFPETLLATSFQIDNGAYLSPQYGYQVQWSNDWAPRERDTLSIRGGADTLVLSTNAGRLRVIGQQNDVDIETLLQATLEQLAGSDGTITETDPTAVVPTGVVDVGNTTHRVNVYRLGDTMVSAILTARGSNAEAALALAQGITLNGTPLFTGEAAEPAEPVSTEEPDEQAPTEEPDEQAPTEEPDEPAGTAVPTGESGFDGTTFTSPGFGFTFTVPDGWLVTGESIAAGDERVQVTNGTSLITIRASDANIDDPASCIGAMEAEARNTPLYATLTLDSTADGTPFHGQDDRGAYALFKYTGDDGSDWSYFVRCEPLVAGESMLIIIQDVPHDSYVTERQARRIIQNAIERP